MDATPGSSYRDGVDHRGARDAPPTTAHPSPPTTAEQPSLWDEQPAVPSASSQGWRPLVHPSWLPALEPVALELDAVLARVRAEEEAGANVLPPSSVRLRALEAPLADVRVLVVGQDPYPTPGHAVGWSFSAPPGAAPLPASLRNLLRELAEDRGVRSTSGDLSPWVGRGVMLLNRVLTVRAGESASHRRLGWQRITDAVVDALAARGTPLVSVLWGRDAQAVTPRLAGTAVVTGVHPSPLSASRGFFGSRPFGAVDAALAAQGAPPMDWSLEPRPPDGASTTAADTTAAATAAHPATAHPATAHAPESPPAGGRP